uniref:SMC_N domain-containing protein n=1 Tax=Syphacia muris TaxID=451379 RepID=A0A0N5APQ3_9BILA
MSLLDTIEIQGIRSIGIGSQNAAVVEFLSPLTVICGSNGSGKTVCFFIMIILYLLGVPAAILEYVVFCHQEESTWPLDEPKKLKERFDEIFQVTSYVKAIDELKKIQKQNVKTMFLDLSSYIRILDESVVKYHMQKMEEINEVLGQLWEQVYHGNDIETIQIKSEPVEEGERRKSYNYRVVMTIDGSEIDMPGRCSAGQKMLASILIRIALSDVFCDKCSIIALDEPTTNLDVLKVENLGDMLAQIIEARCTSSRKNFQLIVITHDDRFVEHLRQLCRPEWVYALSKDGSGQYFFIFIIIFFMNSRYHNTEL